MDVRQMIGKTVTHAKFGTGTVKDVSEDGKNVMLLVDFSEKEAKFVFPDCFDKYLSSNDNVVRALIRQAREKKKETAKPVLVHVPPKKSPINTPAIVVSDSAIPNNGRRPKGGWYRYYEEHFPGYVVLQEEGFMYTARGKSADVLHELLGYEIVYPENYRYFTGGPDINKITERLQYYDTCYIVISGGKLIEEYKGSNHI